MSSASVRLWRVASRPPDTPLLRAISARSAILKAARSPADRDLPDPPEELPRAGAAGAAAGVLLHLVMRGGGGDTAETSAHRVV